MDTMAISGGPRATTAPFFFIFARVNQCLSYLWPTWSATSCAAEAVGHSNAQEGWVAMIRAGRPTSTITARPTARRATSYIARVGGLAVVMGLGAAVAGGQAIAEAQPNDANPSSGGSHPDGYSHSRGAPSDARVNAGRHWQKRSAADGTPPATETVTDGASTPSTPVSVGVIKRSPGTPSKNARRSADGPLGATNTVVAAQQHQTTISGRDLVVRGSAHTVTVGGAPILTRSNFDLAARAVASPIRRVTVEDYSPTTAAAAVVPVSPKLGTVQLFSRALGLLALVPGAGGAPTAPPPSPVAWAVLGWIRREFSDTFFNKPPTAQPQQTSETVDGTTTTVQGTLGATDPNGDPLSYEVTQQANDGTAEVHPDGTYTYTSTDPDFANKEDTFTVAISDDAGNTIRQVVAVEAPPAASAVTTVTLHGSPSSVTVAPDGKVYVTDGTGLEVIDPSSANPTPTDISVGDLPAGSRPSHVVVTNCAPQGCSVAGFAYVTVSGQNTVKVVDLSTSTVVATIQLAGTPQGMALTRDGLLDIGTSGPRLGSDTYVLDTNTNTLFSGPIRLPSGLRSIVVNSVGTTRGYITEGGALRQIDPTTGAGVGRPINIGGTLGALAITPDGSRVYVSDTRLNRIEVVDTATNSVIRSAGIKVNGVTSIAVSSDGSRLYVATSTATGGVNGSAANKLLVIDAKTGTIIQTVPLENTSSLSNNVVAVSADGKQVYVSIEKASSLAVISVVPPTVIV